MNEKREDQQAWLESLIQVTEGVAGTCTSSVTATFI